MSTDTQLRHKVIKINKAISLIYFKMHSHKVLEEVLSKRIKLQLQRQFKEKKKQKNK